MAENAKEVSIYIYKRVVSVKLSGSYNLKFDVWIPNVNINVDFFQLQIFIFLGKKDKAKKKLQFHKKWKKNGFLGIMEKYEHIIECKRTDAISSKSEQKTWDRISLEFNAQSISPEHRPAEKLKLIWDNLKRNTPKHLSSLRQETCRTGKYREKIVGVLPP